ncbi:MAG: hypothetical protein QGD92_06475 [Gammaproteobacteria bacterium]|nr:hypothetical protein [Gammaproteobacteria bacterium]
MKVTRLLPVAIVYILVLVLCQPLAYAKQADPLFRSHDLLGLNIRGPLSTLNRERDKDKRYSDSLLSYAADDGTIIELEIELQVRGNFRLDKKVCRFAPLRVFFNAEQTRDTLFSKQKKLKLVTHCKPGSKKYQQYVIQEYLIYRMFNILSDRSFRVRLVHVTYVDTDKKNLEQSYYGFLIENKKRLAKRLKMKNIDLHRVSFHDHDPQQLNLVSVFQFFIGNTDWSVIEGETEEACCHNAKLLGNDEAVYFGIPYDFDFSGLIAARYAHPNPRFPIRNVRTRYYRGFCQPDAILNTTLGQFRAHRNTIYSLVSEQVLLDDKVKTKSLKYLDGFYAIIEDPKRLERSLIKSCRG